MDAHHLDSVAHLASTVIDGMVDALVVVRPVLGPEGDVIDATILYANAVACTELGRSRDQLLGRPALEAADLDPALLDHVRAVLDHEEPLVVENYVVDNPAAPTHLLVDIRGWRAGDAVALTWRDVTEYADLLDAAQEAEHRSRVVAENSSDVVFLRDTDGIIRWISPSVRQLLGWPVAELIDQDVLDFVHPDDLHLVGEVRAEVSAGREAAPALARIRRSDGTHRWMSVVSRPLMVDGEVRGATVGMRDVHEQVVAQQAAEESEHRFRLLAENASDIVFLRGPDGLVRWISPSVERVLGWQVEQIVGADVMELVHPDDRVHAAEARRRVDGGGAAQHFVARFRDAAGRYHYLDVGSRPVIDGEAYLGASIGLRDVDELVRAQQAAEESEQRYRLLAEHSSDVIFLSNEATDLIWVSPSSRETLGWDPSELEGRQGAEFIHPDDLLALRTELSESTRTGATIRVRYRWRRPDGTYRWVEAIGRPIADDGHGRPGRVVQLRDIEGQVRAEQALEHRAHWDELTGLLTRGEVLRRLDVLLADRRHSASPPALAYCDLDGLKRTNDGFGHAAGDALLVASAERIRACLRETDLVGRMGGDEILVVLDGGVGIEEAEAIAVKIRDAVSAPVLDRGRTLSTTVSIGVALAIEGDDADRAVKRADTAMYAAKHAGRDRVVRWTPALDA